MSNKISEIRELRKDLLVHLQTIDPVLSKYVEKYVVSVKDFVIAQHKSVDEDIAKLENIIATQDAVIDEMKKEIVKLKKGIDNE